MDRCSGSERRPNLDHHVSNPSPHFDPAAGVFLRRPTVPRRLGRKTSRYPRPWRGGPRSAFPRRSPVQPAGWVPRPRHGRAPRRFPRDAFLLFACFRAVSPLSGTTQLRFEVVTDVRFIPPHCWPTAPGLRFIRFAVRAPTSGCSVCSSSIECRRPASNATGTPIVGTPSTVPGPVPISCSSRIATTGSNVEWMGSEDVRERILYPAMPPRPSPEPAMRIQGDPRV